MSFLSSKRVLYLSALCTVIMFVIVMFFVNPLIDTENGIGVLKLQLAFSKEYAIGVVHLWGVDGVENFQKYIFTDYMYAFCYSLFFASLLSYLSRQRGKKLASWVFYLPFIAGALDMLENSMEIAFLHGMDGFSDEVFFFHSLVATFKWMILPIIVFYIFALLKTKRVG